MPLDIVQPPAASISSLNAALAKVAISRGLTAQVPHIANAADRALREKGAADAPTPALSSPVYVLGLDAIAAGPNLAAAKLGFWTHFFSSAPDDAAQVVAADVNADTSRFASMKEGPQVHGFYNEVRALQQAPDIGQRTFELAQLRIPALHVKAVWLKDKAGTGDVVIPIAPTNPALTPNRRYSVAEFLAALRPAAEAAIANTDPLKGG